MSNEAEMLTDGGSEEKPGAALALFNKALTIQGPLTEKYVARLHRNRPDATPAQLIRRLNTDFRSATIAAGVSVGAVAAAPAVGTGVALAISGGETLAFFSAAVLYVLARAEVQGIRVEDVERRRTLVMGVLLGDLGTKSVEKVAERTGQHWAKQIVSAIPMSQIRAVNKVLGPNFVTKYGAKQGIVVLGKVVPFGIGAVIGGAANGLASQGVIVAANLAFGKDEVDAFEDASDDLSIEDEYDGVAQS